MSARRLFRHCFGAVVISSACVVACGWDPSRPFDREAPEVREAIAHLDAGDAQSAGSILEQYLVTGQCKEGNIGTPPRVRARANGGFDLGLALFQLAEHYGKRFGEEESDASVGDDAVKAQRAEQVDCALKLVRAIATDTTQPIDLRARARYLEGNLLFLNGGYEEAVKAYDASLELAPGMHDGGPVAVSDSGRPYSPDLLGRDSAWNRAIALRRIDDKKDAGKDAASDAANDASGEGGDGKKNDDENKDQDKDGGGNNSPDAADDGGSKDAGEKDSGGDDPKQPPPKPKQPEPKPEPASRQNQDERTLEELDKVRTVQQEAARKDAQRRRVRGMADK